MASKLIQHSHGKGDPSKLTDQMRKFCYNLLGKAEWCPTEAARQAGYAQPSTAAFKLLKKKDVQKFLGYINRKREEASQLKANDVFNYLRLALFFNPLEFFSWDQDGFFLTDLGDIPSEIGALIEGLDYEGEEEGKPAKIRVRFVSKTQALSIAMRHITAITAITEATKGHDLGEILQEVERARNWDGVIDVEAVES